METTKSKTHIFDLPDAMIEQVLGYLKYDEIAKKRIVSKSDIFSFMSYIVFFSIFINRFQEG